MTGLIIIVITFEFFRCVVLSGKEAEDKYLMVVHSKNHVNLIRNISSKQFESRRNSTGFSVFMKKKPNRTEPKPVGLNRFWFGLNRFRFGFGLNF